MTPKSAEDSFIELQALEQQLMMYLVHWRCFLPHKEASQPLYPYRHSRTADVKTSLPSFSSGFTAAWALNNGIPVQGLIIWAAREGGLESRESHAESMQVKVTGQRPALIGRNGLTEWKRRSRRLSRHRSCSLSETIFVFWLTMHCRSGWPFDMC